MFILTKTICKVFTILFSDDRTRVILESDERSDYVNIKHVKNDYINANFVDVSKFLYKM